jgi:hypothetical protein
MNRHETPSGRSHRRARLRRIALAVLAAAGLTPACYVTPLGVLKPASARDRGAPERAGLETRTDSVLQRADSPARRVRLVDNWAAVIRRPASASELDRAFWRGLRTGPAEAVAALIDGAAADDQAGQIRARRFRLIGWTLLQGRFNDVPARAPGPRADPYAAAILGQLRAMSAGDRAAVSRAYDARAGRYEREILAPRGAAAIAGANRALGRRLATVDLWERTLYQPEFPGRLDRAYFKGWRVDPPSAVRALIEGVGADGPASRVFVRRVQLLAWTLGEGGPDPTDAAGRAIVGRLGQPDDRMAARRQFAGHRRRLRDEVLAATRAGWFPVEVATQFAAAAGTVPGVSDPSVLALARVREPRRDDLARRLVVALSRPDGLAPLVDADLTIDEIRMLIRFAQDNGATTNDRLRRERDAWLRRLARGGPDTAPAAVARRAGLFGDDTSLVDDLARLLQRQSRRDLARRLEGPVTIPFYTPSPTLMRNRQ